MNPAIAASDSLQRGMEQPIVASAAEHGAALDRSLLLIPLLAAAAWVMLITLIWVAWHLVP